MYIWLCCKHVYIMYIYIYTHTSKYTLSRHDQLVQEAERGVDRGFSVTLADSGWFKARSRQKNLWLSRWFFKGFHNS